MYMELLFVVWNAYKRQAVISCGSILLLTHNRNGNWTTRGYTNSRIANSRTGQLAD